MTATASSYTGVESWWAAEVSAIYVGALAILNGDDAPLKNGPGHIAWADGNFSDDDIRFCLRECNVRRHEFLTRFGLVAMMVARNALVQLLAIPESIRDCDPYCD